MTAAIGLPAELVEALRAWNGEYREDRLPLEGPPSDTEWMSRGRDLLARVRKSAPAEHIVVTEPWWGERTVDPNDLR